MMNQKGFTLVELAIVLMIIGLLIGAVLRGQELMNNARLQSVVKQVMSYQGAISTFKDAYQEYPGDLRTATTRVPGCQTGAGNNCVNGNGDGTIGTPNLVWILNDQSLTSENAQFWKDLALTHIISGVKPNATIVGFGDSHPGAPIGGGFSVVVTTQDPSDPTGSMIPGSLVLRLHNDLTTTVIEDNPVMSPRQAGYIDRKMDDGIPNTGSVQSTASGSTAGQAASQPDCEVAYAGTNETKICTMSFLMNR
jgi:prepilin-type N-terminal cleavage/methylation domain-containing protein